MNLPQVAPGRYQTTVPVEDNGVYELDVQQTDPSTGAIAQQSSGFVVPYSPEYQAAGTNTDFMTSLAQATGGHVIQTADQALVHDLPSVGEPQPLWPYLLMAAAVLMVFDVGVRRVRFDGRVVRSSYAALRDRIGQVEAPGPVRGGVRRPVRVAPVTSLQGTSRAHNPVGAAGATGERGSRLLAARQRARR